MRRLVLTLSVLALAACAPRYSKRHPKPAVEAAAVEAPAPAAPQAEPTPVAAAQPAPAPAPAPVAPPPAAQSSYSSLDHYDDLDSSTTTRKPIPADSVKPKTRDNFYSFSEKEVSGLKSKNKDFRRLHKEYEICSAKSEKAIIRRDEIPTEIAKLRMDDPQKNERAIAKLKEEEKQLRLDQESSLKSCREIETKLTEMLRATYGDRA